MHIYLLLSLIQDYQKQDCTYFFARSLSGSCITAFEKLMLDGLYMSTVLKMGFLRNRLESFRDSKKEVYLIQVKEIPNYIYRCSLLVTKSDFLLFNKNFDLVTQIQNQSHFSKINSKLWNFPTHWNPIGQKILTKMFRNIL